MFQKFKTWINQHQDKNSILKDTEHFGINDTLYYINHNFEKYSPENQSLALFLGLKKIYLKMQKDEDKCSRIEFGDVNLNYLNSIIEKVTPDMKLSKRYFYKNRLHAGEYEDKKLYYSCTEIALKILLALPYCNKLGITPILIDLVMKETPENMAFIQEYSVLSVRAEVNALMEKKSMLSLSNNKPQKAFIL